MIGVYDLGRVGRGSEHLCYQSVRIERDRGDQLFQLIGAECLRRRLSLSIILLCVLLGWVLVGLLKVRLLLIILRLRIGRLRLRARSQ